MHSKYAKMADVQVTYNGEFARTFGVFVLEKT